MFLMVWSAALIYMPILFVQQVVTRDRERLDRLMLMQRWFYANIMTPAALLAVLAGVWLIFERGFTGGWLPVKLALVFLMALIHVHCGHLMVKLRHEPRRGLMPYYWLLPAVSAALIAAVVWLVTGKPF